MKKFLHTNAAVALFSAVLMTLAVLMPSACDPHDTVSTGGATITIDNANADDTAQYIIRLDGPSNAPPDRITGSLQEEYKDLVEGSWQVTVEAYDDDDTMLDSATEGFIVKENDVTPVTVTIDVQPRYSVTFDMQGGTGGSDSVLARVGHPMPSATAPTKTGYSFGGYFTEANGSGTQYYTASMTSARNWDIESDTTLYAVWIAGFCTVTFDSQGGSDVSSQVVLPGGLAVEPKDPARTGYTFAGWFSESGCINSWNFALDSVDNDITLYAKWTANTYTVTFDKQGGTGGTSSVTVTCGAAMPSATAPTKPGHKFLGYYTGTNGSGTQYYTASMASARSWDIASNTTLYAKWQQPNTTVLVPGTGQNTWSLPSGITTVTYSRVTLIGGGGGGASGWSYGSSSGGGSNYGGGGGAGQVVEMNDVIHPGWVYYCTVGSGGNGGIASTISNPSSTTPFNGTSGTATRMIKYFYNIVVLPGLPLELDLQANQGNGAIDHGAGAGYPAGEPGGYAGTTGTNNPYPGAGGNNGTLYGNGGAGSNPGYAAAAGQNGAIIIEWAGY